MGVILGLAATLLYGGSDFAGGLASRKLGAVPVNVVASSVAAALAWVAGSAPPCSTDQHRTDTCH